MIMRAEMSTHSSVRLSKREPGKPWPVYTKNQNRKLNVQ